MHNFPKQPKMKILKTILFIAFNAISLFANSQIFDNVGIKVGAGISNQYWDYQKLHYTDLSGWKENKTGFAIYFNAEKEILPYLSIRPEIGYNQKGFKDDTDYADDIVNVENDKVTIHNLSFDVAAKVYPFKKDFYPYVLAGLKGDYQLSFKDVEYEFIGITYNPYTSVIEDYNKFVLSGILGAGICVKDALYLEFEYNPAFTKNLNTDTYVIHDKYFLISLGINLNKLYLL